MVNSTHTKRTKFAQPGSSGAERCRLSSSEGIWLSYSPVRLVEWYMGLSFGQKIVVGVAGCALVLVGSYMASLLIFSVAGVWRADFAFQGPRPGANASVPSSPSASASASSAPAIALKIERARWEGNKAVVEG